MAVPPGQARRDRRCQMQDAACSAMVPPMSPSKGAGEQPRENSAAQQASCITFHLMNDNTPALTTLRGASGKSTLFKLIGGLAAPSTGTVDWQQSTTTRTGRRNNRSASYSGADAACLAHRCRQRPSAVDADRHEHAPNSG